jgi:nitroreductase
MLFFVPNSIYINPKDMCPKKLKLYYYLLSITVLFACKQAIPGSIDNLPKPEIKGGKPLMIALRDRCSTREFSNKELSVREISNLLWAANGINRTGTDKHTAPSACNRQDIDIYVALKSGVYLFDSKNQQLVKKSENDLRADIGNQQFVKDAPVCLIYIADFSKTCGDDSSKIIYSSADAAYISENVYLFCASENLATVVLGMVNRSFVSKKLLLSKEQKIIFAQPVGFKK